jgi:tetratricopeptide (TPR) repeat protein
VEPPKEDTARMHKEPNSLVEASVKVKPSREDPVKMHKDANSLMESGKYAEAKDLFVRTAELYYKGQNYFDSATMYYKAGECAFALREYEKAIEHFMKSAEISFAKGFDRFGVSALDYAKDCQKALGNTAEVEALDKKIKEVKAKLESAF